jgi:hypothetical protein
VPRRKPAQRRPQSEGKPDTTSTEEATPTRADASTLPAKSAKAAKAQPGASAKSAKAAKAEPEAPAKSARATKAAPGAPAKSAKAAKATPAKKAKQVPSQPVTSAVGDTAAVPATPPPAAKAARVQKATPAKAAGAAAAGERKPRATATRARATSRGNQDEQQQFDAVPAQATADATPPANAMPATAVPVQTPPDQTPPANAIPDQTPPATATPAQTPPANATPDQTPPPTAMPATATPAHTDAIDATDQAASRDVPATVQRELAPAATAGDPTPAQPIADATPPAKAPPAVAEPGHLTAALPGPPGSPKEADQEQFAPSPKAEQGLPAAIARLAADPAHAPELLALTAVQMIGPRAGEWAKRTREAYPAATHAGLARLAVRQFTRFGSGSSVVGAVVGAYAPAALVATVALTHARLILHVAAAYGVDPTDEARAADLLILTRVHTSRDDAAAALAGAKHGGHSAGSGTVRRLGRMAVGQAAGWAAVRLANRYFPGTGLVVAALAGRTAVTSMADRAITYYGRDGGYRQESR